MAPRKLSRMAAAFDAMKDFGVSKTRVTSTMKQLLKEYGGAAAYPFVEADGYKVLFDTLFPDDVAKKREEQSAEGEASMQGDSSEGERVGDDTAGPSAENVESPISQPVDAHLQTDLAEGNGDRGKEDAEATVDAGEYPAGEGHLREPCCQDADGTDDAGAYTAGEVHHQDSRAFLSPSSRASSPELQGVPTRTCKPCYGWIDDEDDDDDDGELDGLVYLTPAFTGIPLRAGQGSEPKRKSRWDVRREDM